jgi:hypothetical protein
MQYIGKRSFIMIIKWEKLKLAVVRIAVGNEPYIFEKLAPYALLMGIENLTHKHKNAEKLALSALFMDIENHTYNWRKNAEKLREAAINIIEHWDIRRVKALIDLFPCCVPKYCLSKVPVCYMADNENADWMVEFQ